MFIVENIVRRETRVVKFSDPARPIKGSPICEESGEPEEWEHFKAINCYIKVKSHPTRAREFARPMRKNMNDVVFGKGSGESLPFTPERGMKALKWLSGK